MASMEDDLLGCSCENNIASKSIEYQKCARKQLSIGYLIHGTRHG